MSWEALFGAVALVLPVLESKREKQHERATAALNALSDAFYSTVAYYEAPVADIALRRRAQIELAHKWDGVANLTRPFDNNLWSRFNLKSRFWREGEAWTQEQVASANIGLEIIRKDARFFLLSKQQNASK